MGARVALAVFTTRPTDILLLDEPTNHLDGAAVSALCAGLRQHAERGGAVVVASHDKAFVDALQATGRVCVSRGAPGEPGSISITHFTARGDPVDEPDVLKPPPSPFTAEAIGGANPVDTKTEVAVKEAPKPRPRKAKSEKKEVSLPVARQAKHDVEKLTESIEKQESMLEEAKKELAANWTTEKWEVVSQQEEELEAAYEKWEDLAYKAQFA